MAVADAGADADDSREVNIEATANRALLGDHERSPKSAVDDSAAIG